MTLDLDALKRLCEQATPGPWKPDGLEDFVSVDADFICAARTALPQLIAKVERLQKVAEAAYHWLQSNEGRHYDGGWDGLNAALEAYEKGRTP